MAPFFIANGVRRAVAARELQLAVFPAILKEAGKADRLVYPRLDELFSPKTGIAATDPRYLRVRSGLSTPAGRAKMPPIEVEPLGVSGQTASVPLKDVQLIP